MKLERSKEWWLDRALSEGDGAVGAGALAFDPVSDEPAAAGADEKLIAFGKFVNLMRRQRGLSMEKLAEDAELDTSELLIIEESSSYVPDPRTVYRLAQTFEVSQQSLMQLAGLTKASDAGFRDEVV